ncbi:MAG: glucose-1-phosphate adenylyltransferase, partial [Candidatus Omnitrophica bacterium]|nr:glucose-1-phosphate adenylyltransferase [Candidatus Omnitrophota bacterium]
MNKVLTFIMAGGKGERLFPLTRERTKPATPFGGVYRIIDFTLSNCINSGLRKICVLTQYKSSSLNHHLIMGWNILNSELGEYIDSVPAQQRISETWYLGTADSIYQNLYLVNEEMPDNVLILAGDHIYKMDYARMLQFHRQKRADLTVAVVEAPRQKAQYLGILEVDKKMQVKGFQEKPSAPETIPGKPALVYASMGIYVFSRQILMEELAEDAGNKESEHDFGKNIIPQMVRKQKKIFAYDFKNPRTNKPEYWRDVGDIDAYYEANMDLVKVTPEFNLYDKDWPIRTYQEQFAPAKTVWSGEENKARIGQAINSLIANGCIISGGLVKNSILSPAVRINSFSKVYDSIIMEGVDVARFAKIRRAIVDKDVKVSQGAAIGYNLAEDRKRFTVTKLGIVVVPKGS